MKRIGWSLPCFSSLKSSKRRDSRRCLAKSEVLEVRSLMSATNSPLTVEEPGAGVHEEEPVENSEENPEENPEERGGFLRRLLRGD